MYIHFKREMLGVPCSYGIIPLGTWHERCSKVAHMVAKQAKDEAQAVFGTPPCLYHLNYRPNPEETNPIKLDYGYHCALYTVLEAIFTML